MKIKGIIKLRLVITLLFAITLLAIVLSIYAVDKETQADEEFFDNLSADDIYELNRISSSYPEKGQSDLYNFTGSLVYIVAAGLFFLMIKVWSIDKI